MDLVRSEFRAVPPLLQQLLGTSESTGASAPAIAATADAPTNHEEASAEQSLRVIATTTDAPTNRVVDLDLCILVDL